MHRIQLILNFRRLIAFQKQIFNDSSILDFVLNSLKRLLHNNCTSKKAETLASDCQQMNNEIHQLLFTSAAIFMLRSETFQTTLVYYETFTRNSHSMLNSNFIIMRSLYLATISSTFLTEKS